MQTKFSVLAILAALVVGQAVYAGPKTTKEKLDSIIIPKLQFEDVPISVVLKYLKQLSKDLDPERKGVNFILRLEPPGAAKEKAPKEEKEVDPFAPEDDPFAEKPKKPAVKPVAKKRSSEPHVTMDMDNLPLGDAVRYVCKATNFKYRVEKNAIIVAHHQVPLDRMETRIYSVKAGFLDPQKTR